MGDMAVESLNSVRQALGIATLRKSMNQDAVTTAALLEGLQAATAKVMEHSVTPNKGGNIDIHV